MHHRVCIVPERNLDRAIETVEFTVVAGPLISFKLMTPSSGRAQI